MKLFRKKNADEHTPVEAEEPPTSERSGSSWTKGRALLTKTISVGLAACIIAGGVAFVLEVTGRFGGASEQAVGATGPEPAATAHQGAGAYALEFVAAWMRATRDDAGTLTDYLEVETTNLSEAAWEYRDLSLVSIEEATSPFVSVTVSANVKETVYDAEGEGSDTWPRRYFQVAVATEADGYSVAALPAPVAAPSVGAQVRLDYAEELVANQEPGQTVMNFLGAYLAGAGELTRFISPRAEITAISPAQFVQIEPVTLAADQAVEGTPADGDTLEVLATVRALNVDSRALTVTYALTLTARDERWEVSEIDSAPQPRSMTDTNTTPAPTAPTVPSSAPTPAPTTK